MAIIMQNENYGEIHEQLSTEPLSIRDRAQPVTQVHMEQTVNNVENYDYIINIFVLIESKCNKFCWRWLERHVGGGQETMIQFVVAYTALYYYQGLYKPLLYITYYTIILFTRSELN